ncbi:MAG: hypothetical protein NT045_01615 [Candidatus Aureabacteria bacterium]|nr:hypothetical protein [Candidatus Auribacterota bacterium]
MSGNCVIQPYGFAGIYMLLAAGTVYALRIWRFAPWTRIAAMAICGAVLLIPVRGMPLYAYPYGLLGELSVTTSLLLAGVVLAALTGRGFITSRDRAFLFVPVCVLGTILYATGMSILPAGIYEAGFRPLWILALLLAWVLSGWMAGQPMAAGCVLAVVAAYSLRLLESDNLWDYLLDPILVMWSWGWGMTMLVRRMMNRT